MIIHYVQMITILDCMIVYKANVVNRYARIVDLFYIFCYNKIMKDNKLLNLAQEFAVGIIIVANELRSKKEYSISDQIKRSGTSISANIAEGNHPQSRADMISKFEIALKEANETENWLNIILRAGFISKEQYNPIHNKLVKIKILLISSIKTLKKNS